MQAGGRVSFSKNLSGNNSEVNAPAESRRQLNVNSVFGLVCRVTETGAKTPHQNTTRHDNKETCEGKKKN